jgi:hypothetical protein
VVAGAIGKVEMEDKPKAINPFLQKDKERRASLGKAPAPLPPRPVVKPAYVAGSAGGSGTPKCPACSKSVFAVEELRALNRVYHKKCFRCSGENKDGCNRVLSKMDYVDGKGSGDLGPQPYCKSCYGKLYGPKGTNARLGSNITNENDTVSVLSSAMKLKAGSEPEPEPELEPEAALTATVEAVSLTDTNATNTKEKADRAQLDDAITNSVFNATVKGVGPSTAAAAPTRRASTLKIGGNLKYDVNKERSFEGDGDEVNESEWD